MIATADGSDAVPLTGHGTESVPQMPVVPLTDGARRAHLKPRKDDPDLDRALRFDDTDTSHRNLFIIWIWMTTWPLFWHNKR